MKQLTRSTTAIGTEDGTIVTVYGKPTPETEAWLDLFLASPDMLEALELDVVFHSRPFVRDSIEEFRAAGYTGPAESATMRAFLIGKKQRAIFRAKGDAA